MDRHRIPLYSQIQQHILDQIRSGAWTPHMQLPPERTMASQFKVSRITAKNAINGLVTEGLLYRHQGKGTFVADGAAAIAQSAQSPIAQTSGEIPVEPERITSSRLVGLIMPWMEFRYQSLLVSGIENELSKHGYHLVSKRIDGTELTEMETIRAFRQIPVAGLMVIASRGEFFNDELLQLVLDKFPLVFVEKVLRDYKVNGIFCDPGEVGYLMGKFLSDQAKRAIGYIGYPPEYTFGVKERLAGFQAALAEEGLGRLPDHLQLALSPELVSGSNQRPALDVPEALLQFLRDNPQLEAIAAVDAQVAHYIGKACWELGRRDMMIVNCDEPSFATSCVMPAAYVDQSPEEMGVIAAELVVSAIEDRAGTALKQIAPKLVKLDI